MALARLSVGIGKKGMAAPHAMYVAREGKYAKPENLEELEFSGHGNMPKWAENEPSFFWQMSDAYERANGNSYREHVIALPRELTSEQRHNLVLEWIEQELGTDHAYQYGIHNHLALDDEDQPHCHLMFSDRKIDGLDRDPDQYFKRYNTKNPEKGGCKKANTGMKPADRKADLIALRERWEQTCNKHLAQAGSEAVINMKSYKDQGIDLTPFNLPMNQFNNPKFKQIYKDNLVARREYVKAIQELNKIDMPEALRKLAAEKAAEQLRSQTEQIAKEAAEKAAEQIRLQAEQAVKQAAEQAEQLRLQALKAKQQAADDKATEQAVKQARKLDTPTKIPVVKIGGSRLSSELDELRQRHDLIADKIDNDEMYEREGRSACKNFFIGIQRTCEALDNAICRVPDKYDMEKYEAVYDAVDRLMGSMEQRMEDVGLKGVNEHTDATDKLQAMRQTLDKHTARIGLPTQRQQQPTPQNTPSPR
jgi:hypothetical protein